MKEELLDDDIAFTNNDENASHEYAQLKYRLIASLIDLIVIILFSLPLKLFPPFENDLYLFLVIIFYISAIYSYFIIQECGKSNATFGKRLTRLIITNIYFDKISIKQSFLRTSFKLTFLYCNLVQTLFLTTIFNSITTMYIIDNYGELTFKFLFMIPTFLQYLLPIILIISIIKDKKYRGWHDKIAGTIVLREIENTEEES